MTTANAASASAAPLYVSGTADELPGKYLVVLKASALDGPIATARAEGGTVAQRFTAVRGFAASLPASAVAKLRRDPAVAFIQADRVHRQPAGPTARAAAPWHLDRIDQRALPLNGTYNSGVDGSGVDVYVIDSGIRATHTEFEGRAKGVYTSINDGRGTNDCGGHGTFVASHVAGKTYGAAKKATIKAVRILNCQNSATTAQIVDGMDWTARNAPRGSIANMSIQSARGDTDRAMDAAAKGMIDSGLLLVLITGNFNRGDCRNSPKDPRAITMGASTRTDSRNTGTNASSYGSCTTAFAPGADVTGASKSSDTATQSGWYGTSLAAPLAAAAVAHLKQTNPTLTLAQAKDKIVTNATKGVLTNVGTASPNRLLYVAPTP